MKSFAEARNNKRLVCFSRDNSSVRFGADDMKRIILCINAALSKSIHNSSISDDEAEDSNGCSFYGFALLLSVFLIYVLLDCLM